MRCIINEHMITGIMSMGLQNCHRFNLGSPVLPSHPSNWELESSTGLNLPFWRRMVNYINTWWSIHSWFNNFASKQQKIAEKYFGKDILHIVDVAKNMSLILINQEPLLAYARPEIPNIVHFSGLHIAKTPPRLSKVHFAIASCYLHYQCHHQLILCVLNMHI